MLERNKQMLAAKRARSDGMLCCVDEDGDVEAIVVKCCWKPTYPEAETRRRS